MSSVRRIVRADRRGWWFGIVGGLLLGGLGLGLGWWSAALFVGALIAGQTLLDGLDRRRASWPILRP